MSLNVCVQWFSKNMCACGCLCERKTRHLSSLCLWKRANGVCLWRTTDARHCWKLFFFSLLFLVTIVRVNLETIRFIKIPGTFSFSYWTPSRCAKILIDKCATVPPASLSISVTVSFRRHLPQFLSGTCGDFVEHRSLSFLCLFFFFFNSSFVSLLILIPLRFYSVERLIEFSFSDARWWVQCHRLLFRVISEIKRLWLKYNLFVQIWA